MAGCVCHDCGGDWASTDFSAQIWLSLTVQEILTVLSTVMRSDIRIWTAYSASLQT